MQSFAGGNLIPTLFLISAGIACLTCFSRPDYNLPLMAFAYLTWDHKHVSSITSKLIPTERAEESSFPPDGILRNHRYSMDPHLGHLLERQEILPRGLLGKHDPLFCPGPECHQLHHQGISIHTFNYSLMPNNTFNGANLDHWGGY